MMEKRLNSIEGGNCTIANLKAQLGQMRKELEESRRRLAVLQGDKGETDEDKVEEVQTEKPGICRSSCDDPEGSEALEGAAKKTFMTQAARANYLCLDRPDIGYATKEAMRKLSTPTTTDETALKKIGKYFIGKLMWPSQFGVGHVQFNRTIY